MFIKLEIPLRYIAICSASSSSSFQCQTMLWFSLLLLSFQIRSSLCALPLRDQNPTVFDLQSHRGGRGETVESTLPSFAWGLIHGAKTLELDNGITKDGTVIVWHDENIVAEKCLDTAPAFEGDWDYPYVGKYIANLTLAQLKTLDCGSQRLDGFPQQLTYPGTKLSTLEELFDFVDCVDTEHRMLFNIESKIDADYPNRTRSVDDFVEYQYAAFAKSPYLYSITYQSFDWRTLIGMKSKNSAITTAALISSGTAVGADNNASAWLAGLNLDSFRGATQGERVARAADAIDADILSPSDVSDNSPVEDPNKDGFIYFTTEEMISTSHSLGREVKPWTVNRLNIAQQLLMWGADGLITDYTSAMRRFLDQQRYEVLPGFPEDKVLQCLAQHIQITAENSCL
ncbi:PLC-like phosphodiesterase [Desarmillaria tabescens]|uniref:PLC-like phosphodiesterase n=1 Tax=Armillaria tabescens TaxID=1929756 RepID=A0AA39TSQ9_ARMTA|nr:PLC-like phosphodiesterase [Desarmillaria tabescens]KAK0465253.1 PLC-like phosphodiesterase [Desarmillaria tabescens]